jgi:hypothetical protein
MAKVKSRPRAVKTKTSVGRETVDETVKRAKKLLGSAYNPNTKTPTRERVDEIANQSFVKKEVKDAYNKSKLSMGTPIISSQQGKTLVNKADQTMNNLAPVTALPTTPVSEGGQQVSGAVGSVMGGAAAVGGVPTPAAAPVNNDYINYINEKTGQEMTLKGGAITEQAKADALKKGYMEASSEISGVKTTPEMAKMQREVDSASREADSFMTRLESMLITDKELSSEIKTISAGYRARQNEMRDINERRQVAMETLGVRTGARYTGGSGGMMGGLLSEEERQGLMRIESIENDKQGAIMQAKKAARDQNFSLYTTLAAKAEKIQEKKATELQALKVAQKEQDQRLADEKQRLITESRLVEIMQGGVTDPLDIYTKMALDGTLGNTTLSDILAYSSNINDMKAAGGSSGGDYTSSNIPEGGYDITEGMNFNKAKMADIKNYVRELFPGSFGDKLMAELTDELLKEYIIDYTADSNAQQMNLDPEIHFMQWYEERGLGDKGGSSSSGGSSFETKLNALLGEG